MLRMNPPDVLHTVPHGIMEYNVGFTLQCIRLISKMDPMKYRQGPRILDVNMKNFPTFQSMHPVRHVKFHQVWDLVPTELGRDKTSDHNTTGLLVMNEYFKMKSLLFQLCFSCIDKDILPNSIES